MAFTREQMQCAADAGLEYECPHIDEGLQRQSQEDPEEGGLMCMSCARLRELAYMLNQVLKDTAPL